MSNQQAGSQQAGSTWLTPGQGAEYELADQDGVGVVHPDRRSVRGNPPVESAEVERATEKMYRLAGN
jgi:hypothetical protein